MTWPEAEPLDPKPIKRELERAHGPGWSAEPYEGNGWRFEHGPSRMRVIVSRSHPPQPRTMAECPLTGFKFVEPVPTAEPWLHASVSYPDRLPSYGELVMLHRAVFGDGYAFQVFAPPAKHVSIHPYCLHLWGRDDGANPLPDFAWIGSI